MENHLKKYSFLLLFPFILIFSFGFYIQKEDLNNPILGCSTNETHGLGEDSPSGSALSKIDRIGFWHSYPFSDNEKKQAELLLWMKTRFEEVGHCII